MNGFFKELDHCMICPRACRVNRNEGKTGYCGCGSGFEIASVCVHKGEEPPLSGKNGIINVFFSGCNLSCIFCQNNQISRKVKATVPVPASDVIHKITDLMDKGLHILGFVSPSHFTPHVRYIIEQLHDRGYFPVTVYNTNAFDSVSELKALEGLIDVYLPDFKYLDPSIARLYSDSEKYPEAAKASLKEMYRQKGSSLILDDDGQVVTGMIIRHLVLPGCTGDSINIMRWIASELSTSVHLSLMSQYYPTLQVQHDPVLGRSINASEYKAVVDEMETLGFYRGWVQDLNSPLSYQPDFTKEHPFESDEVKR